MDYDVCVTTLTNAQVDLFKLALLDVGSNVRPGWNDGRGAVAYAYADPAIIGCVMSGYVMCNEEMPKFVERLLASMNARGMVYLSVHVRCETRVQFSIGNCRKSRTESVYRQAP